MDRTGAPITLWRRGRRALLYRSSGQKAVWVESGMSGAFQNPLPGVPHVESPFVDDLFPAAATDPETLRIAEGLHRDGFAILDFPDPDILARADRIVAALTPVLAPGAPPRKGVPRTGERRIQDAFSFNDDVRSIAASPAMISLLTTLYGRNAFPFQTLNFATGSQQPHHSDCVHFSSLPERFMCGVWVALEDVGPDQGPLVYYPGSHRWPIYGNDQIGACANAPGGGSQIAFHHVWDAMIAKKGIAPVRFHPRKGQALIWAANLLHGGDLQRDPARTRWSQVTHYYFENCAYYTPMHSDPFFGKIAFRKIRNAATGERVRNRYVGHAIPDAFIRATRPKSWLRYVAGQVRRLSGRS